MVEKAEKPQLTREQHYEAIVKWLSEGNTLRQYCRDHSMPWTRVYDWQDEDPVFKSRIARARDLGEQAISEQCLAIADEHPPTTEQGSTDSGYVAWQKNRIWTRTQLLAKWNPRKWGEKVEQTHTGNVTLEQLILQSRKRDGSGS